MKNIKHLILFLVGFCSYITIEVLFRGYSFSLCGLMGAIDFILIGMLNDKISWHMDLTLQCLIGSGIVTLSELIIGTLDKYLLHMNMWDYSNLPFNFNGVICLQFSIAWIFISCIAIMVDDTIKYYVFDEEPQPHYHIGKFIFKFKKK